MTQGFANRELMFQLIKCNITIPLLCSLSTVQSSVGHPIPFLGAKTSSEIQFLAEFQNFELSTSFEVKNYYSQEPGHNRLSDLTIICDPLFSMIMGQWALTPQNHYSLSASLCCFGFIPVHTVLRLTRWPT